MLEKMISKLAKAIRKFGSGQQIDELADAKAPPSNTFHLPLSLSLASLSLFHRDQARPPSAHRIRESAHAPAHPRPHIRTRTRTRTHTRAGVAAGPGGVGGGGGRVPRPPRRAAARLRPRQAQDPRRAAPSK